MEPFQPTIDEIADGVFRISTWIPEVSPDGFTFNQFLLRADEPLLMHTGPRGMFPLVAEAMARVLPVESLRWLTFGHVEADECGSMNMWLAAAPQCQVVFNPLGCDVSLNDLCDRPPVVAADGWDGSALDLGGKRVRVLPTPHLPHGWEAQVVFDETSSTLLCGDVLTQVGGGPAVTTESVVAAAVAAESMFGASSITPHTAPMLRRLAGLGPSTLAIMHGSAYRGDGAAALTALAAEYEELLRRGLEEVALPAR